MAGWPFWPYVNAPLRKITAIYVDSSGQVRLLVLVGFIPD